MTSGRISRTCATSTHSLDVHLAFNGPFDAELTNSIMADIAVLLDYEKYESLLHIFLELLHAVKDRNLDPDWKTKSPRITANSFQLPEVGKLLAKAEKKLGVTHFARAFKALTADLLHVDLK